MRFSVVTVCFNSGKTIADCVTSVLQQQDADIEYIVVDGASRDDTIAKIEPFRRDISVLVSEPDKGIYDAMNKGLALASGDYVGFLNSDDYFSSPKSISKLANALKSAPSDAVIADISQVNQNGKLVRIFRGQGFEQSSLARGKYPPHPGFYARTERLKNLGGFDTRFRIAADFDLMIRFFSDPSICWTYVPEQVVTMRIGGASHDGLSSYFRNSLELVDACKLRGLKPSYPHIYGRALRKGLEVFSGYKS